MDFVLFALFLVSLIYCCDMPAINGFEIFVNDHDSMLYSIGLSIIASYIFYVFQVAIPQILHFRRARSIGCIKLYEIEEKYTIQTPKKQQMNKMKPLKSILMI